MTVDPLVARLGERWRSGVRTQVDDLRTVPRLQLGDLVGGVSVALVLIPQSLAYAGLAGVPPYVGLFAAAFPLLAFSLLASSPYLQTGPVALTSLLTAGVLASTDTVIESDDYIAAAALLAVLVGLVRLVLGLCRFGSIVYLMAEPVMIGFTSGAGVVILSSQLPKAIGVDPEALPDTANPLGRAVWALLHPGEWEMTAVVISAVTLALMLRGRRIHRLFPGVLVAVILALLFSNVADYEGEVVGEIEAGLPAWSLDLPWDSVGSMIVGAAVIALVGFAEPSSIARTFANDDQSRWSSSREFVASGLANIVSGVTGAFPVGGSFSRSSINRFAGARTRWSGLITGLVVVAFLPFAGSLRSLPQAVLGAIVVGAVLGLVKPVRLLRLGRRSPWQAGLAWATWIATLLTPPNVERAVVVGIGLTLVFHVTRRFRLEVGDAPPDELLLKARGLLWIATIARLRDDLRQAIEADAGAGLVTLDLSRTTAIDASIAQSVAEGARAAAAANRPFRVIHPPEGGRALLTNVGVDVV